MYNVRELKIDMFIHMVFEIETQQRKKEKKCAWHLLESFGVKCVNFDYFQNAWIEIDQTHRNYSQRPLWSFAISILLMPRLTIEQRGRAYGMLESGMTRTQVARFFGVSPSTVSRNVRRYRQTGHFKDLPRSGRPRVTSVRQDRYVRLSHLRRRIQPATRTAAATIGTHGRPVSRQTIGRRLGEAIKFCEIKSAIFPIDPLLLSKLLLCTTLMINAFWHNRRIRNWITFQMMYNMTILVEV